jgi:hypothetical protein
MCKKLNLRALAGIIPIILVLLSLSTTAAAAGSMSGASPIHGGEVVPVVGKPKGYSLADAAAATAYFNTGARTPDTIPGNFPFQILYITPDYSNTFSVETGTMLYVPVIYSDDLDAAYWPFPDVTDPAAVMAYYFDPQQLGAEYFQIVVDGKVSELGPEYAAGTTTQGLADGGQDYTVVAAFLTPLSKGKHTVKIAARLSGKYITDVFGGVYEFEIPFTVIVR